MGSSKLNFQEDLDFIRILWCDNANIIRAKAIHINKKVNFPLRVGISSAQQGVPVMYDGVVPDAGLSPVGEIQLEGDISTLSELPYAPQQGRMMGNMMLKGEMWDYCPRGYLKKMIEKTKEIGIQIKGSFENEFYLFTGSKVEINELLCVDKTPFASTQSMDINQDFVMELVKSLESQGITVEQYYPEAGPGQQEITIKYSDAMRTADNQIVFRETTKAVARKHDKTASFLPKIFPDKSGSGCHLHLSLWENGENILGSSEDSYGLSLKGKHFIAGILKHLPAIMALTTPTCNSYRRIQPHSWSGAYQCWGMDNREAAIRVISERKGAVQHFEVKTIDASSNPYLCMGAVIAAGTDGIINQTKLPEPIQEDPGDLSSGDLKTQNVAALPSDLKQAIINLENDQIILDSMGSRLSKAYIAVKKAELEFFKDLSMDEEVGFLLEKF
ncbi:glutamine synthetase family protein [Methanobacterium alcaliphilum]|uniref:glutamine synthetase family protein n=1 Tax=Methanobacterium alcaliphilum TaxID=392018 RepID=UPI00200A5FE2|nr:glutamine synthetase [Methanobacterium alcaliphilum]MCK9151190.1 glutamine synthetase [Methanobacterium alcaliphilum]